MKIHVSTGNSKLGDVPSISLTPIESCSPDIQCAKECYARKICTRFSHVADLWDDNLEYYRTSPKNFMADLFFWLIRNKPTHFRFHVGGDIPDENYLDGVYTIARSLPYIKFMLFTKRHSWVVPTDVPTNLNVLLSMWPYVPNTKHEGIPRAWIRGDLRVPETVFVCKGLCTECYQCWDKDTVDVLLKGH